MSNETKPSPPLRKPNIELRQREFITPVELERMIQAAETAGRHGYRDSFLIALMYRHALKPGEIGKLKWTDIDIENRELLIKRQRGAADIVHSLSFFEVSKLTKLKELSPKSTYVFSSERKGALTSRAVHSIVARAAEIARIDFTVHPQMLCAGRGFQLADEGWKVLDLKEFLGHKTDKKVESYFKNLSQYKTCVDKQTSLLDRGIPVVEIKSAQEALEKASDTKNSITVEVPASTCNLGPGLDTFGLALNLYTRVRLTIRENIEVEQPQIEIKGKINTSSRLSDVSDLIYAILSRVWKYEPEILKMLSIEIDSDVPLGSGLGSLGTTLLGTIWGSHVFKGKIPTYKILLKECYALESHSETTAASLLGGMVVQGSSLNVHEQVVHRIEWPDDWHLIVSIPDYTLHTADSRAVLPTSYNRADVIHNIQRSSLLVAAVKEQDEELFKRSVDDRLHEQYRNSLIPELVEIRELTANEPCLGTFLSGGGSSVITVANALQKDNIIDLLKSWKKRNNKSVSILDVQCSRHGMREIIPDLIVR